MLTNEQISRFIAKRIAAELKSGELVNLGVGLPTQVSDFVSPEHGILMHGENGVIGLGKAAFDVIDATAGKIDKPSKHDKLVINAGASATGIQKGASFFDSTTSFGLIRGGHVTTTVLGAMEVDEEGNLANYLIPGKRVAGMGGAMDLCVGAKRVIVATYHTLKGSPKILKKCRLPLTAKRCVKTIVSEMGVFDITDKGIRLREYNPDYTIEEIQNATEATLLTDGAEPIAKEFFEGLD